MGRPVLLLRLEGPMQSWGARSRWDPRDTVREPTKSGAIGMIGCMIGLERGNPQLERLDRDLRFGVRVDRPGVVSTDFQTVTGYHRTVAGGFKHSGTKEAKSLAKAWGNPESTIVSPRDYLHDASFLVALSSDDETLLAQLVGEAWHPDWSGDLRSPYWPAYLGRKACVPTRPIFDRLTDEYQDIEEALRREPWTVSSAVSERQDPETAFPTSLEVWIERADGEFERQDSIRLDPLRMYGFRRCTRIDVDVPRA